MWCRCEFRLVFAIVLGVGTLIPSARGDDRNAPASSLITYLMKSSPQTAVNSAVPVQQSGYMYDPTVAAAPKASGGWKEWWHSHGIGCWADANSFGCGSLHSTCIFMFGSCRAWYKEPCFPIPPRSGPFAGNVESGRVESGRTGGCGCP
jgi:hypothetical protein